ncbi:MAG: hypothetical protein IIX15_05270 [Clostridia bacterium]|nr:hypothetical protein [Clostridia bacterium]
MSITKNDLKIGQVDFDKTKISRLSDRPNVGSAVGGNTLSPAQMKKKYDESAELIVKHFNALIDALAGFDEYGNRTEGVADLIMTGLGQEYSLADLLEGLTNGEAAQRIRVGLEDYTLKGYLQYLAMQLTDKLEASRIDVQAHHVVSGQEPTVAISLVGEGETARVCLDFGIPEGKQGERGPSGVYVGDGDMPEDASVQIIPDADDFEYYEVVQEKGQSEVAVMSQKATTEELDRQSNALKGSATGSAVRMDDVSPLEHEMVVKVSGVDEVSAVKVNRYGKNLCDNVFESGSINSETGGHVISSSVIRSAHYLHIKPNTTYTMSKCGIDATVRYRFYDENKAYIGYKLAPVNVGTLTTTFTSAENAHYVRFDVISKTAEGVLLQLELGTTATAYEPYIEPTEYTPNADGTVDGVTSLYPTTTLMTDTEGAVIDVEYNRDINKAFDELKQAIISLGGNV